MAIPLHKIDSFTFLTLRGSLQLRGQRVEVVERPGVDDVALWLTGQRGEPFELVSQVDQTSFAVAWQTAKDYHAQTVGSGPVPLVWNDVDWTTLGRRVHVLDVLPEVQRVRTLVGGINAPSEALLTARWKLLAVAL